MWALVLWMMLSGSGATNCTSDRRTMGCKESCPNGWEHVDSCCAGCCSSFFSCYGDKDICQLSWDCYNGGTCAGEGSCECQHNWTGDHCDYWSARIPVPDSDGACDRLSSAVPSCSICALYYDSRSTLGNTDDGKCVWVENEGLCYPKRWSVQTNKNFVEECEGCAVLEQFILCDDDGTGQTITLDLFTLENCRAACRAIGEAGCCGANLVYKRCTWSPGVTNLRQGTYRHWAGFCTEQEPGTFGFQCATIRLENVVPLRDASGVLVDGNGNPITANESDWPDAVISAAARNCWNAGSGDYVVDTMTRGTSYGATSDECISTEENWEDVLSTAEGASETASFEVAASVSASVEVLGAEVTVGVETSYGEESTTEWSKEQSSAQGGSEGTEICTSETSEFEISVGFEVSAAPGLIVTETVTRTSYDATVWMEGDLQCLGADDAILAEATITGEWASVAYAQSVRAGSNIGCQTACHMFVTNQCPLDYCQISETNQCVALGFDCMDFSGTYSIAGATIEIFQSSNCGGYAKDDQGTLWTYTAAGYVATVGNFWGYRGEYRAIDGVVEAWGVKRMPNDHISWSTYQIYDFQCCEDLRRALCYSCFTDETYLELCTGVHAFLFTDCDIHTCEDTPGWVDSIGSTCIDWAHPQLCADGSLINPINGGEFFNYPENNCCACGKE